MKYSRLKKGENPNNSMADSFVLDDEDWIYRTKETSHFNYPQDSDGEFEPSSQPYAMNFDSNGQFMFSSEDELSMYNFLVKDIEVLPDLDMNPIGDLDNLSLYELSTCIEGDTSERRYPEEDPLFTEDPFFEEDPYSIQVEDSIQRIRDPKEILDPLELEASEDAEDYFNYEKEKTLDKKQIKFPPYTYPMEGFESGTPYSESIPYVNTYPMN